MPARICFILLKIKNDPEIVVMKMMKGQIKYPPVVVEE